MKPIGYSVLFALLILALAAAAGCTTAPQPATPAPVQTPVQTAVPVYTPGIVATQATQAAAIDTTIRVKFNDLACISVQDLMGVTYLYPDDKFMLDAAPPSGGGVNVNVLFVDENDQLALRQAKPQWNEVQKGWVYESVVPLVQFNDITKSVEKSFTIKRQSKYYICADDRKEGGSSDISYLVPVKLTRL